jgi:hypothetical protein
MQKAETTSHANQTNDRAGLFQKGLQAQTQDGGSFLRTCLETGGRLRPRLAEAREQRFLDPKMNGDCQ